MLYASEKMMGAARKMATVVVFGLLITTVSAGRVSMLSSPTSAEHMGRSSLASITSSSSTPSDSTVRIGTSFVSSKLSIYA